MSKNEMPRPTGLVWINRRWYYRQRVPNDLVSVLGKDQIKISLRTSDYAAARKQYDLVSSEVRAQFVEARRKLNRARTRFEDLSRDEVDQLGRAFLSGWLQRVADVEGLEAGEVKLALRDAQADLAMLQRQDAQTDKKLVEIASAILREAGYGTKGPEVSGIEPMNLREFARPQTSENYLHLLEICRGVLEQGALAALRTHVDGLSPSVRHIPAMMQRKRSEPTLGALIAKFKIFLADRENRPKTDLDYDPVFQVLSEVIGDKTPLSQITIEMCEPALQLFRKLPPNARKLFPGKPFKVIAQIAETRGLQPVAQSTARKNIVMARFVFEWAKDQELIQRNPIPKFSVPRGKHDEHSRDAFSAVDLKKIFSSKLFSRSVDGTYRDKRAWVLLMLLYQGFRLNEVCQLRMTQIYEHESILVFDMTKLVSDQRVKTSSARRVAPVHPVLLKLGFREFVAAQNAAAEERLFPDFKKDSRGYYSQSVSRWGSEFLKKIGVKDSPKIALHSFRHSFRDAGLRAGLSDNEVDKLGAWKNSGVSSRYGSGTIAYVPVLLEQISRIQFGLDFEAPSYEPSNR